MKEKKLVQIVTKSGVYMLLAVAFLGVLACFDLVFDWDLFPTEAGKNVLLVLALILCVLILCCVLVSAMLNISRMANAIEDISQKDSRTDCDESEDKK